MLLMYALLRSIMPRSRMECQVLRSTINAYILHNKTTRYIFIVAFNIVDLYKA